MNFNVTGVLISQEGDTVWAYNLSECPLFVNSPTLDEPHSRSLVVYKLPPGHCQRIFSWERAEQRRLLNSVLDRTAGPENSHSVRISFAKGWGPKYSRQEVTVCHCWLEVLLTRPAR
jgi:mothers against decapentaplegic homolog 6